jgi:Mg-chelatase subunit ChlD/tetratricopeptide (TPR) repeat protein
MTTTPACEALRDELAALVDGDADALRRHAEHLAECDDCRDLRHEARRVAERTAEAGREYAAPGDLEARVLAALAARGPGVGAPTSPSAFVQPPAAPPTAAKPEKPAPANASAPGTKAPFDATAANASPTSAKPGASRTPLVWLVGLAAAAALVIAVATRRDTPQPSAGTDPKPTITEGGQISRIARASSQPGTGVSVRAPGASDFRDASSGAAVAAGSTVRTDASTRARLELADGTVLVLNRRSELTLDATAPRTFTLPSGEVLADVTHLDERAPHAFFRAPTGEVEVLGTKFLLTADAESASVRVTRGQVRVRNAGGQTADVKAGQEGVLAKTGAPSVTSAIDLGASIGWSELEPPQVAGATGDAPIAGLGELRAKRPGDRGADRPLTLASHKVTVRIVGNVARTEIEEVFRNDGSDELEGIYRFPLPPDARISRLALDVDGRMEEGAFVEKDRASKIWRGVIRNATRPAQRLAQEEYIWVPGPWRDPALLEWQQGGRFELRIFPIPARGERRIIIGYTQTVTPHGDGRRYVYPLPFGSDPSLRVGRFEVDARIGGASRVMPRGYDAQTISEDGSQRVTYSAQGFLPTGDLVLEYATPGDDAELRSFTYAGSVAVPSGDTDACTGAMRSDAQRTACTRATAQNALAGDTRPYVAFALRPELPAHATSSESDFVFVVDASQSMVGERFTRAQRLVTAMVAEMDRRDRFVVLACDATCRAESTAPRAPSAQSTNALSTWLAAIRPAGASDVVVALRAGVHALDGQRAAERALRVIYVGDGLASVGTRRVASIAAEAESLARDPAVRLTTVGIGGDADTQILATIARAGGGHYVPYVPGERAVAAALSVLETTYGSALEEAVLELPEGVVDVAPARLPTIRAGQEILVTARLTRPEVTGEVVLRGKVGGQAYLDRYPVTLRASNAAGNLFVPRLWATGEIEKLALAGGPADRDRIVALSKGFGVMSRETSLLVLESEQMMRAFGVDREQQVAEWSGEEDADATTSTGTEAQQNALDALHGSALQALGSSGAGGLGALGGGFGGGGGARSGSAMGIRAEAAMDSLADTAPSGGAMPRARASRAPSTAEAEAPAERAMAAPTPAPASPAAGAAVRPDFGTDRDGPPYALPVRPPPPPRGGQWMRRVWFKVGEVSTGGAPRSQELAAVSAAENALRASPDSRDRHRDLVRALSRAGQLARAEEIAQKWLGRDALDAEALTYLADVVGRQGRRDDALRLLSGVVDLRPDDAALHERLAWAFQRAGMRERACAHRVALAELGGATAESLGTAFRCEVDLGRADAARRLLDAVTDTSLRARAESLALAGGLVERGGGEVTLDATWIGGDDIDVSLVTPQGTRLSWMGGRKTVYGEDATSASHERLAMRSATVGDYVVEVSRTRPDDLRPLSGTVQISAFGMRRALPFTLAGTHAAIGRVQVRRESRLEAVFGPR